ncbi:hypothetical protein OIU34_24220 [Pararhizobium sp. BT-229]|uniref:hypothetical protein n=1 Tax=Pararhizobium sp. BT-229 TaxID=2986923 RepID=UPI0021F77E32|nr:hypothetical protein [Pararhizobium sp. BT-229]MCV9965006.1 hypothetical protein [Pararhizobium sp. BT-229]
MSKSSKFREIARVVAAACVVAAFAFTLWTQAAFVVAFFDGGLLDERLDATAETIISLHADVLTSALLLIFVMLFRRSLTVFGLAAAVVGAFGFGVYDFMDNVVHPALVDIGVYDFVTRGGQAGVTPQVSRSFALLGSTLALFVLCLLPKTRTRDRFFVLLIAGAVIVTTFIFHLALPMGVLRFEKDRVALMMLTEARYVPTEVFCSERTCVFLDREFREIESKRIAAHPLPPSEFVARSAEAVINGGHSTKYVRSTSFNGTTFAIDGCLARHDERLPVTDYMCFSDARLLDGLGRTTAAWMGFLSSVAHGTWYFGGAFLLWLHKRRFRIKRPATAR